jgi:hypothetical protein
VLRKSTALLSVLIVAALTLAGGASALQPRPKWGPPLRWHLMTQFSNFAIGERQLGTGKTTNTDTPDDTIQLTFDTYGFHVVTHSAPYKPMSVARYVPKGAKAVRISLQTVISRSPTDGNAVVYAYARPTGSGKCQGPPGFLNYPADYSYSTNNGHDCQVAHGVVLDPGGEVRQWSTFEVALDRNRAFDFSWGYRMMPQDALAIGIYLDGYAD